MNIDNIASYSTRQSYMQSISNGNLLTPIEFIAKAKTYYDNKAYVELAFRKAIIVNAMIEIDDFLIIMICENAEQQSELKTYEIDEFFDVFGYEDFEIIWHTND